MSRSSLVALVLALVLAACSLNEHGPWVGPSGTPLQGDQVIEFDGFAECGQRGVVFLRFFGRQYARDLDGVLGELHSPTDGGVLAYDVIDEPPPGATATEVTHESREIYTVDSEQEDYLYVRLGDGRFERWPRAEVECDQSGQ